MTYQQKIKLKKLRSALLNTTAKLNSAINRLTNFESLNISQESLPLSSILFIIYGNEVVSFVGGNYEQYLNFGGATLLNSSMITYAFENHFERYNFTEQLKPIKLNLAQEISSLNANLMVNRNNSSADLQSI